MHYKKVARAIGISWSIFVFLERFWGFLSKLNFRKDWAFLDWLCPEVAQQEFNIHHGEHGGQEEVSRKDAKALRRGYPPIARMTCDFYNQRFNW